MSIYIRMPTINFSVTQSIETLAVNLSASEALVMNINNPLIGASYFGLETIPDSNGVYTSAAPKNTSGSFTLGTGILGVVRDDYKMSAVVSPGNNVLTFSPAVAVTGSTLRTRGIGAPLISTSTPLLDLYPNAAAAYSVRKLSSPYTGSAIRVRRSSDNTEQDIGFSSGNLDTTTLTTFCSGTDGFVTTWYDQSDNGRNAIQTTAANQPQIVSSGSVITENGKPAAQFDGTDDAMTATGFGTGAQRSVFLTMRGNGNGSGYENYYIFLQSSPLGLGNFMHLFSSDYTSIINANYLINTLDIFTSNAVNDQSLITNLKTTSTSLLFKNSTSLGTGSGTQNLEDNLSIGRFDINYGFFKMQEMVVYNSDESSSRTGIETNINSYYGIY